MATFDGKLADTDEKILIGKGEAPAWLTLGLANRHGLVTGAAGTGKTVSRTDWLNRRDDFRHQRVARQDVHRPDHRAKRRPLDTSKVVGGAVADLGKSVVGSIGRALVRGAPGGLLRH